MYLKSISATNLKGKSFTHPLQRGVLIVGPNFTNKSSIPLAIVLLLKGYVPEVGKLPKSTWELSSGQRMTVRGEFDDGDYLERQFWLEGATVKSALSGQVAPHRAHEMADIPLLDADQYFGMTDSQRTNYVFSRMKLPEKYTADAIIAELEQISFEDGHTEQIQKAKTLQVRAVKTLFDEVSIQDALEAAVEMYGERFTEWNRRQKDTQGAVKTLTELKLREAEISTESVTALTVEMNAAKAKKQRLDEKWGELTGQKKEIEANAQQVALLKSRLESSGGTDYDTAIARFETFMVDTTAQLEPFLDEPTLNRRKATRKELADQIALVEGRLVSEQMAKKQTQRTLETLSEMKCCPTCKAKAKGWKTNVEKELEAASLEADTHILEFEESLTKLRGQWRGTDKAITTAELAISNNLTRQRAIENARRDRDQAATNKKTSVERREEWAADLAEREKRPTVWDEAAYDELESDRRDAAAKITKLEGRQDAAKRLKQDLLRASEAQLEHLQAAAHVAVIKRIQAVIADRRNTIVADVFTELLVIANKICGSILITPLTLHNGTIGRWSQEGKFIPHRVFSGTEKALAYISIATALSSQAPIRLVILDELGRLDEDSRVDVLKNLQRAVKDEVIDQFIMVLPTTKKVTVSDDRNLTLIVTKP